MTSESSVAVLPFVGPKYAKLLENLGIKTVRDLLYHLPTRYIDLSKITPIDGLVNDETQVVQATVQSVKKVRTKGGKVMINATVADETGTLLLTWFNQPFMEKALRVENEYRFAGEVEFKFGHWQMINPTHEPANKPPVHTGRLVPVYPQTAGISSKWLRARIAPLLSKTSEITPEFLPPTTLQRNNLPVLPDAMVRLHAPNSMAEATAARHRLAFDELLLLQLASLERKLAWQKGVVAPQFAFSSLQFADWLSKLPFELTAGQRNVLDEILADMEKTTPMNRLLEGDVGSGKTVVAVLAAMAAVTNGYQAAIMAPTSVLAQQHFVTFQFLIERLQDGTPARRHDGEAGGTLFQYAEDRDSSATLLNDGGDGDRKPPTANRKPVSVSLRTAKSKSEPADITIGTHALISENAAFQKLGLVIIDEQHRFGVEQRAILMNKAESGVHLLTMTATPIPRTLALTAYGDLDLSIIDQLPANRLPIKTHVVPQRKRADMEGYLAEAMQRGEQVFVVCPLIEESEKVTEVRAVTAEFERLQKVFSDFRLALLHGRMKAQEKDAILEAFKRHEFDLLVATPVVEVGIDVPNATMLVIEGAERFGLAQLHQLRGRVGRGEKQSYCFLLSDATDAKDIARLRHMEAETSGIRLAELDLATRGPGEVYGHRQSGIPELKAASFMDVELTQAAREEAEKLLDEGSLNGMALKNELDRTQRLVEMN